MLLDVGLGPPLVTFAGRALPFRVAAGPFPTATLGAKETCVPWV